MTHPESVKPTVCLTYFDKFFLVALAIPAFRLAAISSDLGMEEFVFTKKFLPVINWHVNSPFARLNCRYCTICSNPPGPDESEKQKDLLPG